jgi:hypothetical protein
MMIAPPFQHLLPEEQKAEPFRRKGRDLCQGQDREHHQRKGTEEQVFKSLLLRPRPLLRLPVIQIQLMILLLRPPVILQVQVQKSCPKSHYWKNIRLKMMQQ